MPGAPSNRHPETDIDLPDGICLDFCLWVKAQPDLAHVPVLLCPGHDDPETPRLALEAGALDFMAKPFVVADLIERIRSHLQAAGRRISGPPILNFRVHADPRQHGAHAHVFSGLTSLK